MVLSKNPYPIPGELVVCSVMTIQQGYVQVKLEDYRGAAADGVLNGMVHISEVSNRWVKNIHSLISVGQKVVLLVLRVNEDRGYVDLSLRRVTLEQRTNKVNEWRYANKAENLLKFFGEQNKTTLEDMYKKIGWPLIEKYGDIHTAFEEIKDAGITALDNVPDLALTPEMKEAFFKLVDQNVEIKRISISAEYNIRCPEGQGINIIKEAILSANKIRRPKGIDVKFYYIGAPIYRCEIVAPDYPTAEKFLDKLTKKIEASIDKHGTVEINREGLSNEQKTVTV